MAFEFLTMFPYIKMGNYIWDNYYTLDRATEYKLEWPVEKMTQIWYWYEQGIDVDGYSPVDFGGGKQDVGIIDYLVVNTPYPKNEIILWLEAIQALATAGDIDPSYYTVKDTSTSPFAIIKKQITDMGTAAKWGAGLATGGLVLYLAGPFLKLKMLKR